MTANRPFYVYDNWSAYDELSDMVPLTEALSMHEFEEVCRLRRSGVVIDAYLMDAFWYSPDGGYRIWREDGWPRGPDAWLRACAREGILPGLWFTANTAFHLNPPTAWRDSLSGNGWGFSCDTGGFMAGFMEVLDTWYARGVRVFKFDFADFDARAANLPESVPEPVRDKNVGAFRRAMRDFREGHPDAILLAYNGFEDTEYMTWTDRPTRAVIAPEWFEVFDTVYCGDPRPADTPLPSFWRTLDVYADAMVHLLHRGSGRRLAEIDNCAFMIGNCGTCYRRGSEEWRTTALLSYARGGRVHVTMGNLEALSDEDGKWLADVQRFYAAAGEPSWVGGNPGRAELYAYAAGDAITAVNPSIEPRRLVLGQSYGIVYSDGAVENNGESLSLGPGSVAVVARGAVGAPSLGDASSSHVPRARLEANWTLSERGVKGELAAPAADLHLVFKQTDGDGFAVRTSGGSPPDGKSSAQLLRIDVRQGDRRLNLLRPDDKVIWSGISWAYGIVPAAELVPGERVKVSFQTDEARAVGFDAAAYGGVVFNL
jgi:hypothetical protein